MAHHYVFGSGSVGCLYDYGPETSPSKEGAIDSLWQVFGDNLSPRDARHMRAALRRDGIYYFADRGVAGADYCEVSRQSGPCPPLPDADDLEAMVDSYVEAALWSSTESDADGNMGSALDEKYGPDDILRSTMRQMRRDCRDFAEANAEHIDGEWSRAGHDFWLTRNGHGAGFWDGDWPEPAASRLTEASKAFGSVDLYVYRGKVRE